MQLSIRINNQTVAFDSSYINFVF